MATKKTALLSPAVNAQQQLPSQEAEESVFTEKFGTMAYQAFSAKHPDLVQDVVTFKVLDCNLETGTAIGAFILENQGEFLYVPAILSENQLKPFDLMYVKSKDIFLPLSTEWIAEVAKGDITSLGEGVKMPNTVATDVDIRNIVVPPTTGRYSYASVSPRIRLEAASTEPLGRKLQKLAAMGMPAAPAPAPGQAAPGGTGFDPELWMAFVDQFNRVNGMTPGQALDQGTMDIETMNKMYKSHMKTWTMPADQATEAAPATMMPAPQQVTPGLSPQQMTGGITGGMPKTSALKIAISGGSMGGVAKDAVVDAGKSIGGHIDNLASQMVRGGLLGASTGAAYAAADKDLRDVPGAALRGGMAGAVGAPLGGLAGRAVSHEFPKVIGREQAALAGRLAGGAGAGYLAAKALPTTLPDMLSPSQAHMEAYMAQNPDRADEMMQRMASDRSEEGMNLGIKKMLKHAVASSKHSKKLPVFLKRASNATKKAFAKTLERNPRLLKKAVDIYGETTLLDMLTPSKTAGLATNGGDLIIANPKTKPNELAQSFGSLAPEAFNGILVRGYYYKDTRPSLKLAVSIQEYHDYHECQEPGIYFLYNTEGAPEPALVLNETLDLCAPGRNVYPDAEHRVKHVINKIESHDDREPQDLSSYSLDNPPADVDRSHSYRRLAIFGNGDYLDTDKLFGEQVTEVVLKSTELYKKAFSPGRAAPAKGTGMFLTKRGAHYMGTCPVEISEMSTDKDGVVRGKLSEPSGWSTLKFVIDPRSPISKPKRLKDQGLVIIPASWKWIPLKDKKEERDFIRTPRALGEVVMNHLGSMGGHEVIARKAGENQFAIDGSRTLDKVAALRKLAVEQYIHASAAESMLKIAELEGICRAHVVTPAQYEQLDYRVKLAEGMMSMGAPPAMQQGPTPDQVKAEQMQSTQQAAMAQGGQPGAPSVGAPPGGADPGAGGGAPPAPATPAGGSPVDQAFSETMSGLQSQMDSIQSQLSVLQTVQQRAQQIASGQPSAPPAQSMQPPPAAPPAGGAAPPPTPAPQTGAPAPMSSGPQAQPQPGADPSMGGDPSAQQQGQQPQQNQPIMSTESPSSEEIQQQINPSFLEQAGKFQDANAFDTGAIASMSKAPSLKDTTSEFAANFENTLDDLGRTLLTMYMQEAELKTQLGDDTFVNLETQLRDTFQGMGNLILGLTHNSAMLHEAENDVSA